MSLGQVLSHVGFSAWNTFPFRTPGGTSSSPFSSFLSEALPLVPGHHSLFPALELPQMYSVRFITCTVITCV